PVCRLPSARTAAPAPDRLPANEPGERRPHLVRLYCMRPFELVIRHVVPGFLQHRYDAPTGGSNRKDLVAGSVGDEYARHAHRSSRREEPRGKRDEEAEEVSIAHSQGKCIAGPVRKAP